MVDVNLWSGLRRLADDTLVVTVEAETIGQMLDALVKAHPGLEPVIEAGVSVTVDGVVYANDRSAPVKPDSEVYLLQQLKGG